MLKDYRNRESLSPVLAAYSNVEYWSRSNQVTTQFEYAHLNVVSNMLVCVVSRYILWCAIYVVILLT